MRQRDNDTDGSCLKKWSLVNVSFFLFADDMLLCVESKLNLSFLKLTIIV